jgi:hypothetical protein
MQFRLKKEFCILKALFSLLLVPSEVRFGGLLSLVCDVFSDRIVSGFQKMYYRTFLGQRAVLVKGSLRYRGPLLLTKENPDQREYGICAYAVRVYAFREDHFHTLFWVFIMGSRGRVPWKYVKLSP